jgi:radical SAM superfamily enzyme YgiQ (UPF0313 family)
MHLHFLTIHAMPSAQSVPLAAASLKAFLDARPAPATPLDVTCSEVFTGAPPEQTANGLIAAAAGIIALPLYLWNREECCALVHELRRRAPDLIIIGGGPEATADAASLLNQAPFDFLVVGEGELTLAEAMDTLAAGASLDQVPGVARLVDGALVFSPRPPVPDLGILPSPWLAGLLDDHIAGGVVWQLSRGCSFGCAFCFDGMGDRRVRRYPLARLEAELDYVVQRGASQVFVLDSTFNQDVRRAKTLLRLIGKKAPGVHCHFEVRHELLDEEQARLFAQLTCSLQIGLQSADPVVAQNVGRKFDRRDFVAKISLLNEAGCVFGFDLIYGLPGETLASFRRGLDFALALYPNHLDIFPLSVLPGTALAARADVLGLRHLSRPPYTLRESPDFPETDMASARRLGAACDIFYSRGKAVAWFNSIIAALRLQPAEFLSSFDIWLRQQSEGEPVESDYGDESIWQLQRRFLSELFARHRLKRLLPLTLDCVDYHYHYGAAVMAVPPTLPRRHLRRNGDLLRYPLVRPSSARLASFTYEISEILDAGEPDLLSFYAFMKPAGSWAVIYPCNGEVRTESLSEPWFRFLERLDGRTPAGDIAAELGISADESREFLAFALSEGMVTAA